MRVAEGRLGLLNRRNQAEIERLLAEAALVEESGLERRLVCAACGHIITEPDHAITVAGQHRHRLTNPAGITFDVGCFRAAPGCRQFGLPTSAHSWFPGCYWRFALCGACGEHLGWAYSGAERFFGLIVSRLRSSDERE